MIKEFRLPDAGEGLTEAEIVSWKVQPGDTVSVNDVIVEIETAKSLVELPCPFAGVVSQLLVAEGTTVDVGTPIISVETDVAARDASEPVPPAPVSPVPVSSESASVGAGLIGGPAPGGRTSVLVGYGPRTAPVARRPRRAPAAGPAPTVASARVVARPPVTSIAAIHVLAKPPVRKLARDLGVDLVRVEPTGDGGIVTREDVEAAAAQRVSPSRPDSAERETLIPVRGVRRLTADAMVASAFTAPHVSEWVQVDVTRTMKLVGRLRQDRSFDGVKVSPLLVVAKALLIAVRRNPGVNASWADGPDGAQIVQKHYVNLGIAAATPRGLVVPNIKDADRLGLRELADAVAALTATAREGRTQPADMSGGTITITNVGVFGIDAGTPIINPGEAAILCFGQVRRMPWVHRGKVKPRWVTQLAVSFDHRLVDGDLGSRFLSDVAAVLEDPSRALVWS